MDLKDVLVVPHMTKNLLSISRLTKDNSVDVLLSYPTFFIQDRLTKQVIAQKHVTMGFMFYSPVIMLFWLPQINQKLPLKFGILV
jgi:hypothetical protein